MSRKDHRDFHGKKKGNRSDSLEKEGNMQNRVERKSNSSFSKAQIEEKLKKRRGKQGDVV